MQFPFLIKILGRLSVQVMSMKRKKYLTESQGLLKSVLYWHGGTR